jgi:hypothetical protein
MSQDKKVVAETKLSEEEKLSEEKTAGFIESVAKTNTENITREIATVMMWKVGAKTPKIDPGDQVMQFLENQLLNRVISTI